MIVVPTVIVVDASVLVSALADAGPSGVRARAALAPHDLTAPELIDLEVTSALRGLVTARKLTARRAGLAIDDLVSLPLERAPHVPLVSRAWELRGNLTPYDAAYVTLAELLHVPLVTADARLARSRRLRCRVDLVGP